MITQRLAVAFATAALCALGSCFSTANTQRSASVLEYLYPQGVEAQAASELTLALPARVGVAFVPSASRVGAKRLGSVSDAYCDRFNSTPEDFNENARRESSAKPHKLALNWRPRT